MKQNKLDTKAKNLLNESIADPRFGRKAYIRKIEETLSQGVDLNIKTFDGYSLFMLVCRVGMLDWVKKGVEAGVDINQQNELGWTPLMWACHEGHKEVVAFLIEAGASLKVTDSENVNLLMAASVSGIDVLIESILSKELYNINETDIRGYTALIWAARNNQLRATEKLLEKNADVTIQDKKGQSAFFHAVLNSNIKIAELLLNKGVDINETDNEGRNVFCFICYEIRTTGFPERFKESLRFLKSHKINMDLIDKTSKKGLDYLSEPFSQQDYLRLLENLRLI
jgi:ankyrin repeat protein